MMTDTNGIDPKFYLDYSDHPGWVSPYRRPQQRRRKNKSPIRGESKDILWIKNNGKIYEQVENTSGTTAKWVK